MFFCAAGQMDSSIIAPGAEIQFNGDSDSTIYMVADINITGYKRTKPYIIEREIPVKQGQYLSKTDLKAKLLLARQQVMNTALFVYVNVYIAEQKGNLLFINVDVKERWYFFPIPYFSLIDRNFNQWWVEQKRDFNRTNYGLKFLQQNVSGRNDELQVWFINGYSRQVSLRYVQPFADKSLKHGFNIGFGYAMQRELNYGSVMNKQVFFKDEQNFVRKNFRVDASYLYRPAIKARHSFRIGYTSESLLDTIVKLNPNYFENGISKINFLEIGYGLQYFNVDYIPYPTRGLIANASFTKKGFSKNMNAWIFQASGTYTIPLRKKTLLQFQGVGSLSLPLDQPYYNQRLFGYGEMYMRGLEYYVVDGVAGIMGRVTGKQELFSIRVRTLLKNPAYRQVPFRFFIKAYGDAGYAYGRNTGSSTLTHKPLRTWGVGLDIITIYDVVFKLEYSFNQLGDRGFYFHTREDF